MFGELAGLLTENSSHNTELLVCLPPVRQGFQLKLVTGSLLLSIRLHTTVCLVCKWALMFGVSPSVFSGKHDGPMNSTFGFLLTPYTLTSEGIFSILLSIHFQR